jgi:hypothetical protein
MAVPLFVRLKETDSDETVFNCLINIHRWSAALETNLRKDGTHFSTYKAKVPRRKKGSYNSGTQSLGTRLELERSETQAVARQVF